MEEYQGLMALIWSSAVIWIPIVLVIMGGVVRLRITDVVAYRKLCWIVLVVIAATLVTAWPLATAYSAVKVNSIWDSAGELLGNFPNDGGSLTYAKGAASSLQARAGEAQQGLEIIFLCYMIPLFIGVFFGAVEILFDHRDRDNK